MSAPARPFRRERSVPLGGTARSARVPQVSAPARPFRRGRSVPLGGSETRGSKPACAGLDRSSAWRVSRLAARSARVPQ